MRNSQICPSCGTELARVSRFFDHELRLRFVRCPTCQRCQVQRRTWSQLDGRTLLRVVSSLATLIVQVTAACLALIAAYGFSTNLANQQIRATDLPPGAIVFLGIVAVLIGIWLSAGLNHWGSVPVRWGVFFGLVASLLAIDTVLFPLVTEFLLQLDPEHGRAALPLKLGVFAVRLIFLAAGAAIALLGLPLGHLLLRTDHTLRRARGRWRRRRRRRGSQLT